MTLHSAILQGEEALRKCGIDQPRWNAERVLLLALKIDRTTLYRDFNRNLNPREEILYQQLLQKRGQHYPLAYMEGSQEFYGRPFHVDRGVLIPRPETEEIIRAALSLNLPVNPKIVDLGAGSGCIAATLAREIPGARVFALERSVDALRSLRLNANTTQIIRGDFLATPFITGSFDLVTANPPYVDEKDFYQLPPETRWEPRDALIGESVERTYQLLLQQSARILKSGGYLICEIGYGQSNRIQAVTGAPFLLLEIRKDYRGIPRCCVLHFSPMK